MVHDKEEVAILKVNTNRDLGCCKVQMYLFANIVCPFVGCNDHSCEANAKCGTCIEWYFRV